MPTTEATSPAPDIRTAILDAATRRFAGAGYEGTSLRLIASDVSIRKPSLLYHFSSKDELRTAVVARMLNHWNELIPELLAVATTGDDRFNGLVGSVVAFFYEDKDRARLIARELLDRPAEIGALLTETIGPWLRLLADYIERGKKEGIIHEGVDAQAYVLHVIQLVVGGTAASPVLASLMPGDDAEQRVRSELVRLARASLFVPGASATRPT